MKSSLNDSKPLFLQIKERIEDQIVNNQLRAHDQIPSTTQLVQFYKINHITVSKGINLLVDSGILYKKRGVGMFVAEGAKELLLQERKHSFVSDFLVPMMKEANLLGIPQSELIRLIEQIKGSDTNEL